MRGTIISTSDLRGQIGPVLRRVLVGRERFLVCRRGEPDAAIISIEDLERLEALDEREKEAREAS